MNHVLHMVLHWGLRLRLHRARRVLQQVLPFAVLAVCGVILAGQLRGTDLEQVAHAWAAIRNIDWICAGLLTALSFYAVSQYDVIAHRHLDTGLSPSQARRSGMTAVALSQTLGFGIVTGTLARWRLLRQLGATQAALITASVSVSFMIMLVALTALVCLFFPIPAVPKPVALLTLAATGILLAMAVWFPQIRVNGRSFEIPSLRAIGPAGGWAAVDVLAAGAALWILIPDTARPELLAFLPAFLIALCAGLFSGTPGGVGPFELVLLALAAPGMPAQTDLPGLLVAIAGFRLVYFAIPACLAGLALIRPNRLDVCKPVQIETCGRSGRAEIGVIRQNGGTMEQLGPTRAALWSTSQALVGLFDPVGPLPPAFFKDFAKRARNRNRFALLYKCTAQTALSARRAGWTCLRVAHDAIVDTDTYSLNVPERSGLRRKLRKAARTGVAVRRMQPSDAKALARLDADWQRIVGPARGGTMGQFCLNYLSHQVVLVAELNGRPVAFASFHVTPHEWALDLMRSGADLPDGAMHMLVHDGIEAAAAAGAHRVSLAAVPACPNNESAVWRHIAFRVAGFSKSAGLRQFKSSFAPRWMPLYLAAPTPLALFVSTLDVAREVIWPRDIQTPAPANRTGFHNNDEDYEIVSSEVA